MTTGEVVQKSVYMYKVLDGQFKCFEGHIVRYPQRRDIFYVRNSKKFYTVSEEPNVIHCGNLWMAKRNDVHASEVFVQSYHDTIDELKNEIARMYELIRIVE